MLNQSESNHRLLSSSLLSLYINAEKSSNQIMKSKTNEELVFSEILRNFEKKKVWCLES